MDLSKAFDTVNHTLLFNLLKQLQFPQIFLNKIKNFYTSSQARILFKNIISQPINLQKGVRQGCPTSMFLFVLYINCLLLKIQNDLTITPLFFPGLKQRITSINHADDINFFILDIKSYYTIKNHIDFCQKTKMKLNLQKSVIWNLNGDLISMLTEPNIKIIENTKIFGIQFRKNSSSHTIDQLTKNNKNY